MSHPKEQALAALTRATDAINRTREQLAEAVVDLATAQERVAELEAQRDLQARKLRDAAVALRAFLPADTDTTDIPF